MSGLSFCFELKSAEDITFLFVKKFKANPNEVFWERCCIVDKQVERGFGRK